MVVVAARPVGGGASPRRSARTPRWRARPAAVGSSPTRSPRNGRSMTAYGRPPMSTTAVASDSSIGTDASPNRTDAGAVAERLGERGPSTSATSSTVWCSSTSRSPRAGPRGRTARGGRATSGGGRRSRRRWRSPPWPVAVEVERDGDLGLAGLRDDGDRRSSRASTRACRGASSCRAPARGRAISRSFSSGSRTVSRRESASGCPARTCAARGRAEERLGGRRGGAGSVERRPAGSS